MKIDEKGNEQAEHAKIEKDTEEIVDKIEKKKPVIKKKSISKKKSEGNKKQKKIENSEKQKKQFEKNSGDEIEKAKMDKTKSPSKSVRKAKGKEKQDLFFFHLINWVG